MKKQKIYLIVILLISCVFLTGCMNKEENILEKVNSEVNYIDVELIRIISKLNNISFSNYLVETKEVDISGNLEQNENNFDNKKEEQNTNSILKNSQINVTEMVSKPSIDIENNEIDWSDISYRIEILSDSWNTIILDLYKLNVKPENMNNFSNLLDQLLIAIKNEDKSLSISLVANLYGMVPKFIADYSNDAGKLFTSTTKLHILNAYVGASIGDWTLSNEELTLAEEAFDKVMKNEIYMSKKEYNINRAYVNIKELQTSNKYANTGVFFLKYKSTMQELANIFIN